MKKPKTIHFQGQEYFDDRLFVLYLCKGKITTGSDDIITTTIYHDKAPNDHLWCIVTYRNCHRYPAVRVDSFYKKDDAMAYLRKIEPETPLISSAGKSPAAVVSFEEYQKWKKENGLKEYIWKEMFIHMPLGASAKEHMIESKENFKGIK
jgi:hypothetical protein